MEDPNQNQNPNQNPKPKRKYKPRTRPNRPRRTPAVRQPRAPRVIRNPAIRRPRATRVTIPSAANPAPTLLFPVRTPASTVVTPPAPEPQQNTPTKPQVQLPPGSFGSTQLHVNEVVAGDDDLLVVEPHVSQIDLTREMNSQENHENHSVAQNFEVSFESGLNTALTDYNSPPWYYIGNNVYPPNTGNSSEPQNHENSAPISSSEEDFQNFKYDTGYF